MVRFTGEYVGGMLAGAGVGIVVFGAFVLGKDEFLHRGLWWFMAAPILVAIGSSLARYSQQNPKAVDDKSTLDR